MLQRTSGQKKCILKVLFCKAAGNSKRNVLPAPCTLQSGTKKTQKGNTDAEIYQNKFHIYFILNHKAVTAETSPPILSGFDYVIATSA